MSNDDQRFTPVKDLDPNVWYHITEERVDKYGGNAFTNRFQIRNQTTLELRVWVNGDDRWQFQPVGNGQYAMRCSTTGITKQLSVCYVPDEKADGHTRPCLEDSHGGDEQKWEVSDWNLPGNTTYRFTNAKNGTKFWMDVYPGGPILMNPDIDTSTYKPAQRWLMSSAMPVNDDKYSTTFTNSPSSTIASTVASTTASTTTSTSSANETADPSQGGNNKSENSSDKSGSNVGVAAGAGVGVGLAVIILGVLAFWLWRRRRRAARSQVVPTELVNAPYQPHESSNNGWSTPPKTAPLYDPHQASQYPQQYPQGPQSYPQYPPQNGQQYPPAYYAKQPEPTQELDATRLTTHELHSKSVSYELNS